MQWSAGNPYRIALFYRYVAIDSVNSEILSLRQRCENLGLLGRVLVSREGINGTLAGSIEAISSFVAELGQDPRFAKIDWKFTDDSGDQLPFLGLSIREVDEIISCGRAKSFIGENISFDSESYGGIAGTGTHLTPQQFHDAIARKDGIVLDVRNEFEYDIGHFDGSKNLKTFNYAETFDVLDEIVPAPSQVDASAASKEGQDGGAVSGQQEQNIYMYCTGGIRCEKASAYLCAKGFKNVFQVSVHATGEYLHCASNTCTAIAFTVRGRHPSVPGNLPGRRALPRQELCVRQPRRRGTRRGCGWS